MHAQWQDSSDERDEMSSVASDAMPDSGVLSSGITSPASLLPPPAACDLRTRVADLENLRDQLTADLAGANKVALIVREISSSVSLRVQLIMSRAAYHVVYVTC